MNTHRPLTKQQADFVKAVYTHGALTTTRKQAIDICLLIHLGQHFNIKKKNPLYIRVHYICTHLYAHLS